VPIEGSTSDCKIVNSFDIVLGSVCSEAGEIRIDLLVAEINNLDALSKSIILAKK
jgi:hypothetical protein